MSPEAFGDLIASIPIDWMAFGFFAILVSYDVLRNGAGRECALALALPVALLLSNDLPNAVLISTLGEQLATPAVSGSIFLILTMVLFTLFRRMDPYIGHEYGQPLQALIAGCATTFILIVTLLQVPSFTTFWQFDDALITVFGSGYTFWWLLSSYAALAFIRD